MCVSVCGQEMIIIRMTNDQSITVSEREGGSKRKRDNYTK